MWGAASEGAVMAGVGHNSAGYGETLREQVETILSDDHETQFRYVQWHIGDYITGTMGMELEAEGAYMRFLVRLYQRGKPLPDDDRYMSTCMNLSLRVWKRVRDTLISVGKIIAKCGCLTNARFEKERLQRAATARKQAEAARQRWEKQRAEKMGLAEVSPKFGGSLAETSTKISENFGEKLNEINDRDLTEHMLTNNQYPITIDNNPPIVPPGRGDGLTSRRRALPDAYPNDFEEFWKLYPRKVGKGAAFKLWQKLTLEQKRRAWSVLKRDRQALADKGEFCPHPSTWLSQGRFDDDPETTAGPEERKPEGMPDFIWQRALAAKREAASR